jgi:hypothetical protein
MGTYHETYYLLAYKNTLGTNLFQVYPEEDWGLMSKFSSQKEIYDEIFEKQVISHKS